MKMNELADQLQMLPDKILKLRKVLFVALVIVLYVFVALRVNVLSGAQPNQKAIASQESTIPPEPQIDQATVNKIKQLQNNSVSVQALFNEARQDPFQE